MTIISRSDPCQKERKVSTWWPVVDKEEDLLKFMAKALYKAKLCKLCEKQYFWPSRTNQTNCPDCQSNGYKKKKKGK